MEIIPGQTKNSGSGLTLGTPIPPTPIESLATTVSVAGLPPELLRPQVIEAVVMRNSLLPSPTQNAAPLTPSTNTATTPPSPNTTAQPVAANLPNLPLLQIATTAPITALVRIALQWQGKTFEVMSPQPQPVGTPLRIQVGERNELLLRSTPLAIKVAIAGRESALLNISTTTPLVMPAKSATTNGPNPINAASAPAALSQPLMSQPTTSQPAAMQTTLRERVAQILQPLIRENLPRQQPLSDLLPALRALVQSPQIQQLPTPVIRAILNLWQTLPKPQQLQQPDTLKQALRNSGHFFEARAQLARTLADTQPDALPRVLGTDLKAQLIVLLTLLRSRATAMPSTMTAPSAAATPPSAQQTTQGTATKDAAGEMVYSKPLNKPNTASTISANSAETIDSLLQQLGKTLEGGLSRIHLNQMDSILSRHSGADPAQTTPTWVLDLPVQTSHGQQQVNLRIEEHARQQENATARQWIVQLAFDLHELGKFAANLTIIGHSVAATLWAEHEQTHRTVSREMDTLRAGLESVGVRVTEMQCCLGVPPTRSGLLDQRLVDTHS